MSIVKDFESYVTPDRHKKEMFSHALDIYKELAEENPANDISKVSAVTADNIEGVISRIWILVSKKLMEQEYKHPIKIHNRFVFELKKEWEKKNILDWHEV